MRIWDITLSISPDLPVWPGDPRVRLTQVMSLDRGDVANVSHLSCSVHTGTHVDAPRHFVQGGATVDQLPLEVLVGPAYVLSLPDVAEIGVRELQAVAQPKVPERLLLRTRNSACWQQGITEFREEYVALTAPAAAWLVEQGVKLIGIDYLSIQQFKDERPDTHRSLLRAGVVIVEGFNLQHVAPGWYRLVCLPLKIVGSDGAPARAILIED